MPNKILPGRQQKLLDTQAIEAFTEDQIERFQKLSDNLNTYQKEYEKLTNQFRSMSRNDENYEEVKEQLKDLQYNINGISANRNRVAESLKTLGREDVINSQEVLDSQKQLQDRVDDALASVMATKAEIAHIEAKQYKSQADYKKLQELDKQLEEDEAELKSAEISKDASEALRRKADISRGLQNLASNGGLPGVLSAMAGAAASKEKRSNAAAVAGFEEVQGKLTGPLGTIASTAGKIFDVVLSIRNSVNQWVDTAADVLSNNVGRINAALEGTGKTYQSVTEGMVESLGLNRFVKQTDYISQIANLTSRGITFNVEQRALLETIKDKTIESFSSMEGSLLRLVRLTQQDITASQFGLEVALRNTLNRVFKDSTYMKDMYDSISNAITDAVVISGRGDVTEYSSTIQTWMGAMYESGINSGTVNKIASALNALGSGNVSALASDADMQRLILLSMDTIGMDYADILQQGLSSSDITNLLTAVVEYLTKIESNTKDNNVLTSSYTQLFGMSMADLQGFKNLSNNIGSLSIVNMSSAMDVVQKELSLLQSSERTIMAEQINNIFDNAKFTFGSSIAKDSGSYLAWKVSDLMIDTLSSFTKGLGEGKFKKILQIATLPFEIAQFGLIGKGFLSTLQTVGSLAGSNAENGGPLMSFINGAPTYGGNSTSTSSSLVSSNSFKSVNTMSMLKSQGQYQTSYASYSGPEWESMDEEEDKALAVLKDFQSALVQAEADTAHKAFATYLVGMTDDTLRSFASIFADEDAMADTFTGENNVLKDNLFKYAEDTTSNSTTANTKSI